MGAVTRQRKRINNTHTVSNGCTTANMCTVLCLIKLSWSCVSTDPLFWCRIVLHLKAVCVYVWIGVWSVAESAKRISSVAEGREDVCLIALGHCRSGTTNSEWASGKVSLLVYTCLLSIHIFVIKEKCRMRELPTKIVHLIRKVSWQWRTVLWTQVDPLYQPVLVRKYGALVEWLAEENQTAKRNICHSATLSIKNPIWARLGSNQCLYGDNLVQLISLQIDSSTAHRRWSIWCSGENY
jgi:hypothetical protein